MKGRWMDGRQTLLVKNHLSLRGKKNNWIGFVDGLLPQKRFLYKSKIKAEDVENAKGNNLSLFLMGVC